MWVDCCQKKLFLNKVETWKSSFLLELELAPAKNGPALQHCPWVYGCFERPVDVCIGGGWLYSARPLCRPAGGRGWHPPPPPSTPPHSTTPRNSRPLPPAWGRGCAAHPPPPPPLLPRGGRPDGAAEWTSFILIFRYKCSTSTVHTYIYIYNITIIIRICRKCTISLILILMFINYVKYV